YRGDVLGASLDAVRGKDFGQHLAVPVLLENPHRQEGGDLGVGVRRRDQQVAQVADGVALDVGHVTQGAQGIGRQRAPGELVVVDVVVAHPPGAVLIGVNVEAHAKSYTLGWGACPNRSAHGSSISPRVSATGGWPMAAPAPGSAPVPSPSAP